MGYKEEQKSIQVDKLKAIEHCFNNDKGFGDFDIYKNLPFVLKDGKNNLCNVISDSAFNYFQVNNIDWWGDNKQYPTGHLLSSQIQCLNFLFPLKDDKEAVLELARLFDNDIEDVLPVMGDVDNQYISFEFVYDNEILLGENDFGATRGAFCTSVDAFIFARRKDARLLIPIEWKYTEVYDSKNKALEYKKGLTRQKRYNHLIKTSKQLTNYENLSSSPYYYEPFYEFMRQTLLMEQMIKTGIADDFLHVIAVSSDNKELMGSNYIFSSDELQTIWSSCLIHPEKCKFVETKKILTVFENKPRYTEIQRYLKMRYD